MNYLEVSSNDGLSHRSLSGSPETLCGRLAVDQEQPNEWAVSPNPNTGNLGVLLPCDVCLTLSGGDSILKQTQASLDCPYCEDGVDASGLTCLNCGGSGWLSEDGEDQYAADLVDLSEIDTADLRGTKVASGIACENCGNPTGGLTITQGNEQWCANCASSSPQERSVDLQAVAPASKQERKTATNWTREGEPIEDGFTVVTIDKERASRTPFLDYTRVAVSEKRECPDCNQEHWLSKIASCSSCDGLKCTNCMESIGLGSFMGTCKKCADADSDIAYESAYEDTSYDDQSRFLSYLMQEEDTEIDSFFLPNDPE